MRIFRRVGPTLLGVIFATFLALSANTLFAMSVKDVPNPRDDNAWVSDTVEILDAAQTARINRKLNDLEVSTGVEVAMAFVDSVDTATPKDFATALFNRWKIGKEGRDNGLLILLVMAERRLEMETGYGLESTLSDGWLKRMQMNKMVPRFKQGRYAEGLETGVDAVIQKIEGPPEQVAETPEQEGSLFPTNLLNTLDQDAPASNPDTPEDVDFRPAQPRYRKKEVQIDWFRWLIFGGLFGMCFWFLFLGLKGGGGRGGGGGYGVGGGYGGGGFGGGGGSGGGGGGFGGGSSGGGGAGSGW